jgi:SNF2 family DNA or RNA helicase
VYQFKHEVERIKQRFPHAVTLPTGKALKQCFDDWNAGKIKMLVIHPASAGHGLNLQFGGRRMIWTSPTWNLEHWLQTLARLLRHGATETIYVHRLLVKGTRDMQVRRRINTKDENQKFILDEIKRLRAKYNKS